MFRLSQQPVKTRVEAVGRSVGVSLPGAPDRGIISGGKGGWECNETDEATEQKTMKKKEARGEEKTKDTKEELAVMAGEEKEEEEEDEDGVGRGREQSED